MYSSILLMLALLVGLATSLPKLMDNKGANTFFKMHENEQAAFQSVLHR
jgi:hypothetical protein